MGSEARTIQNVPVCLMVHYSIVLECMHCIMCVCVCVCVCMCVCVCVCGYVSADL